MKTLKLILPGLVLVALIFFSGRGFFGGIRGVILSSTASLLKTIGHVGVVIRGVILTDEDASRLIRENQEIKAKLFELESLRAENRGFRKTLGFRDEAKTVLKGARVIHYMNNYGKEFLLVNQGKSSGIVSGSIVLDETNAVVGIISEVENDFSKVEIASNPGITFDGQIHPLNLRILAHGVGARAFSLELIPANAPVRTGDFVVLTGSFAGFRSLMLLGEVTRVAPNGASAFAEVHAVLLVHPELLSEVFILQKS